MDRNCKNCGKLFSVTDKDLAFYDKISPKIGDEKFQIPVPSNCPSCRMQIRMAHRNQSSLYRRNSSKSGKEIISMFRADAPFPVYSYDEWMKDDWDAKDYGRDFDFSKTFFEQFEELRNQVPHMALLFLSNINCDFCNIIGHCKNCYLIYGSIECEDCYYGNPYNCKQCVDSFLLRNSELCLECVDSDNLYNCYRSQDCSNSSDLMFCKDVHNSSNCFCCVGLNHKNFCVLNKQYSKQDYEKIIQTINLLNPEEFSKVMSEFNALKNSRPHRYYVGTNNENVSGNFIFNSKDCKEVYGVSDCRDVSYSFQLLKVNDSMDLTVGECGELNYNVSGFYEVSRVLFSYFCWANTHELLYCGQCTQNVKNCFGCISLKKSEFCILNKQYSKEEYENLLPRIIEHMKSTGEWGEFFPVNLSPFAYNETIASEFFPLKKDQVIKKGWKWFDENSNIHDVPKDAVICEVSGRPFKIIPQEKKMYARFGLPLPKRSPHQRHLDRIALRDSMELKETECVKCGLSLLSPCSLDSYGQMYCEKCYLAEVY